MQDAEFVSTWRQALKTCLEAAQRENFAAIQRGDDVNSNYVYKTTKDAKELGKYDAKPLSSEVQELIPTIVLVSSLEYLGVFYKGKAKTPEKHHEYTERLWLNWMSNGLIEAFTQLSAHHPAKLNSILKQTMTPEHKAGGGDTRKSMNSEVSGCRQALLFGTSDTELLELLREKGLKLAALPIDPVFLPFIASAANTDIINTWIRVLPPDLQARVLNRLLNKTVMLPSL